MIFVILPAPLFETYGTDRRFLRYGQTPSHLSAGDCQVAGKIGHSVIQTGTCPKWKLWTGPGCTRDADGFAVHPTPSPAFSPSSRANDEGSRDSSTGVRTPSYRRNNLYSNGINVRHARSQLSDHNSCYVKGSRAERGSPSPPPEQIDRYLNRLKTLIRGHAKADVEEFLKETVFIKDSDPAYGRPVSLKNVYYLILKTRDLRKLEHKDLGFLSSSSSSKLPEALEVIFRSLQISVQVLHRRASTLLIG
ncbi:hypothetical protein QBC46DRAFT_452634 [Diplogelasinospora grovesii]|uniref:Uncharacterized protein n=1 Tax=Diplogelasinospora grovesii TaxID=303347 RepID=A0AAN6MZU8_9PEZI|nr:hypothetical protein QBC46DRAFT_452634 [Diplogelasinospora grovesii]